jgi:hypothetical protein
MFLKYTQWQCILINDSSTAMNKFLKTLHPGGIRTFCYVDGRDDHHATPPTTLLF